MNFLEAKEITKIYGKDELEVCALNKASFYANKNELVVILGASGSGKSTLLNILGGMDRATRGELNIEGETITDCNEKKLAKYRRNDIGFVFQFYNLMPNLTALENVALAVTSSSNDAKAALEKVGLKERMNNFPAQLSGGEQQRVAIARAIVKSPKLLLCDEPTGALDSKTGKSIIELLKDISKEDKLVIVVTHNANVALIADRVIKLQDGSIVSNEVVKNPKNVDEIEW